MPKRCALGCSNKNSYHQFPHPERNPEHFKAWVHIAGGKLESPADYELYRKKVICDIHFTDRDRNRNNRLNFLAVPSLYLPGKSGEVGTSEKVLLAPETVIEESSLAMLKPTLTDNHAGIIASALPAYSVKSDEVSSSENRLLPPESVHDEGSSAATLKLTLTDNCARFISTEHNYCRLQKKMMNKMKYKHKQVEESSFRLNKLKKSRTKIKFLQSSLIRSQRKVKTLEAEIARLKKCLQISYLKKIQTK